MTYILLILIIIAVGVAIELYFKAKTAKEDNRKLRAMIDSQEDYYFLVDKTFEVKETNYCANSQPKSEEPLILGNVLHCKNAVESGRCGHAGACKSCPIRFVINKSFERADDFSDLEACMEVYDGTNKLVDMDVMLDGHYITLKDEGHLVVNVKNTTNEKNDNKRPKVLFITANVELFEKVRETLTPIYRVLNADNLHQARQRLLLASTYQFHAIMTDEEFYKENQDILQLLVKNDNLSLYVFTNNDMDTRIDQVTCLNKDFDKKELLQILSLKS
jgi:hypothetical protein